MKPLRWLLLPHYLYFLLLPSLALVATAMLGEQRGVGSLCLFGLLPVTVFIALMAYCYTVPRSLLVTTVYVFAAPLLVSFSGWFSGGDTVVEARLRVFHVTREALAHAFRDVALRGCPPA